MLSPDEDEEEVTRVDILSFAAKAMGIDDLCYEQGTPYKLLPPFGDPWYWNPEKDYGDLYEMVRKLDMIVDFREQTVLYEVQGEARTMRWPGDALDDKQAIILAAYHIGKSLP